MKRGFRKQPLLGALALAFGLVTGFGSLGQVKAAAPEGHGHEMHSSVSVPKGVDFSRTDEFDFDPPPAGSYVLPKIRPAADGQVLDVRGDTKSLKALLDGKITLLSFIYTRCTDAQGCPLATAVLHEISDASEVDRLLSENLRMISLSFDPEHDTPEVMAGYRGDMASHKSERAEWIDLTTGSNDDLGPILKAYDQVVRRRKDSAGTPSDTFGHQLRAYLIDRNGLIRNIYGLGFLDPRLLATDVYTLLLEEGASQP
jgi:protein SCO1